MTDTSTFSAETTTDDIIAAARTRLVDEGGWLTLDEVGKLPLRGADLRALLESVSRGRPVFPLELLADELSI